MKFKVGDKVRVLDGSKIEDYTGSWVKSMEKYVGNVYEVEQVTMILGRPAYRLSVSLNAWDERGLELVESVTEEATEETTYTKKEIIEAIASVCADEIEKLVEDEKFGEIPECIIAFGTFNSKVMEKLEGK